LLATTGSQGSKTDHEEVETREGDQVDSHLPQVGVQLTRELFRQILNHVYTAIVIQLTRRHVVIPLMTTDTRWLRSPYVGVDSFKVLKQIS
jgi:hypothetical protein